MERYIVFRYIRKSTGSVVFNTEKVVECSQENGIKRHPGLKKGWKCPHNWSVEGDQIGRELREHPWPVEIKVPDLT